MVISLGNRTFRFFISLGEFVVFSGRVFSRLFKAKHTMARTVDQMVVLGVNSLPVTIVTACFVGMAFTMQVVNEFLKFGAGGMIGGVVGMAMWRELVPMLTGVVISARVGAAISAELGTMKVTEQVDALESMSQDPVEYLVIPRVLASTLMLPVLIGLADILGFFSGLLIAVSVGHINPYSYMSSAQTMLTTLDITGGLLKAVVFGMVISLLSCFMGLNAKSGAKGVGDVTTKAVVTSLICVFILNYLFSVIIYSV
jgi:phospholipid/cholesterol/gamma-HCH transport system permease protein